MPLSELLPSSDGSLGPVVRGVVDRAPATIEDSVRVIVPAFDGERYFDVPHWSPRGVAFPAKGDEALVCFNERGEAWLLWDGAFDQGVDEDLAEIAELETEEFGRELLTLANAAELVAALGITLVPTGALTPFAGASAPAGYLLCDGSAVSRTTYDDLWDVLRAGTASSPYGNGDGSTTFNLPDLRGRVPVGEDGAAARLTANDSRGNASGAEKHTLAAAESGLPAHKHTQIRGGGFTLGYGATAATGAAQNAINASTNLMETNDAAAAAASNAHNNMQPFQVVNYIIKT